jgi:hypothetical protein
VGFAVIGEIEQVEIIAAGKGIRRLAYLRKRYGSGRWRKMKGTARVRLENGRERPVELHWYEAHGIGRRGIKIKRYLG